MIRKLYFCLALAILTLNSTVGFSQSDTKFDFYLALKQHDYLAGKIDGSLILPVFVKGNMAGVKKLVESNQGIFKYSYGNIAAVQIPVRALPAFMNSSDVTRMEGKPSHMHVLNDTMRVRNHMVEVQMGQSPLTQPYKGKGVVLGYVDSGIDFLHPDFRDSTGKTRIAYMWDQNVSGSAYYTPQPYNYGLDWSRVQIDSVLANHISDTAGVRLLDSNSTLEFGHGSGVAGTGSGNGRANGQEMGADPESDIIMVAYNFNNYTNPNLMTDAVNYIYTKASLLGEPCVINASLGDYDGSHDGQDLQAQMIDSMTLAQPGRCFVAAAGNAGNVPYHLGYTVTSADTNFTWFAYDGSAIVDIPVFADTANFRHVQFSIGVDKSTPDFVHTAQTNFRTIFPYLGNVTVDTIKNAAHQRLGIMTTYAQRNGGVYSLEFQIVPDSTTYYWRFTTTGTGKFDAWNYAYIVYSGLPTVTQFAAIANYKAPDTFETVCSSFQCSPHTITVADYWNRECIIDYDTQLQCQPLYVPGQLIANSSVGPTRDGRIKPDVSAPGGRVMTCLPTQYQAYNIVNAPTVVDAGGWHIASGGTSFASPEVAGAAGMLFGLYPLATADEIRSMIICGAVQDALTGPVPNTDWGYGKLDAFKSMTNCFLGLPTVTNPLPGSTLTAYPNPTNGSSEISYDFTSIKEFCIANIKLYDVYGREVKSIEIKNSKGQITLNKGDFASGTYFYSLIVDGNRLKTEKLVIF